MTKPFVNQHERASRHMQRGPSATYGMLEHAGVQCGHQVELNPRDEALGEVRIHYPLDAATRRFGKLIDAASLRPGDLILTRPLNPDVASNAIVNTQIDLGYGILDARWTHGFPYLGLLPIEPYIIEADIDNYLHGDVRLTTLQSYSQGQHVLRVRRPIASLGEWDSLRLCLCAMSRLGRPYAFRLAWLAWLRSRLRRLSGGTCNQRCGKRMPTSFICSSLYADAYSAATQRQIDNCSDPCLPACLSAAGGFYDVMVHWNEIR